MTRKFEGFTLIELMIAVAVIGILAAIAYPSYTSYVMKARRSDAKAGLLSLQLAQEKYRANNPTYGDLTDIGLSASSPDGHYTIGVTLANNDTTYTATAAPTGVQAGDKCGTFQITNAGVKSVTGTATDCW